MRRPGGGGYVLHRLRHAHRGAFLDAWGGEPWPSGGDVQATRERGSRDRKSGDGCMSKHYVLAVLVEGVLLAFTFLVLIPAVGLVLGAALGIDMAALP